ncbi:hypothetical protein JSE7799_03607 [Jannaschia seosinensis]|uniref:Uncharacterized protein n=1 Tax=Jannaschia seosinensis TaxID=313367 RepID=A0A0M7BDI8_9RHOB|nr:hypothetical protein [Jannaschia seosinensis]CUH40867.1 hypothetical protein JSE7799_03607 [Jannaschia seosinensis]
MTQDFDLQGRFEVADPDAALIVAEAAKATAAAEERLIEMRAEMAVLRETIRAELGEALTEARLRIATLQKETAEALARAEHHEREVQSFLQSTSWRITTPLRALSLRFRSLPRM